MQTYDILMLVVLASATIFGAIKGFAWQVASLASIIVSFFVASYFRNDVAALINAQPPWNMFLAMLLLYFGSSLIIWMLFRLVSTSIDKIKLKEFDRQLGAAFGLIKGAVLCCVITMFAMTLLAPAQQQAIANSKSGYYIGRALSHAGGILPDEAKQVIGPYIERVNQQLEAGRDPNYVPDPNAPNAGPNLDAWGRALENKMSEVGNGWMQGQGGASETSRPEGGILNRLFPPRGNTANSPPANGGWNNAPGTAPPMGTLPPNSPPQGWPVSTPSWNPNVPLPGTSPQSFNGNEILPGR